MRFPMVRKILFLTFFLCSIGLFSRDVPKVSLPVTDEIGILSNAEIQALNQRLISFSDTTSNQIALLITDDIGDYSIDEFTIAFGHKNGPGQKGVDNGIAIVIVPKTSRTRGQMFIAAGYGLEGVIPDALAARIVDYEFIPEFKRNNYFGGIKNGLEVIMQLASKEISVKQYKKSREAGGPSWVVVLIILFFIIYAFTGKAKQARKYRAVNNVPFWLAMSMLSQNSRGHRGYYNNFSNGSGPFGGGGGFGGFGGGGFGGGGAGGSW